MILALLTTLIATYSLVSSSIPLKTSANAPHPNFSPKKMIYFPILFFGLLLIFIKNIILIDKKLIKIKFYVQLAHHFCYNLINSIKMYYRRWTRMHFKPGLKYYIKYGVISPKLDKFTHMLAMQNPDPLQYRPRNPKKVSDKDLDTKLINNLFLKYPDLKYEPISKAKYPGQQFNTYSYAYAFINEQKKLMKQGYTISKAFELTEAKYHEKMQRKLDQSLLSRGLAFSNRARSFLNVYQQQVEYQSRLKTQRTQRELQKYQMKLDYIRQATQNSSQSEAFLTQDVLNYERTFIKIKQHNRSIDSNQVIPPVGYSQIEKTDKIDRFEFINEAQTKFKNLFDQFYEHAATKDKLQGLTDEEIINQIQTSPSKIKRQMRELLKYFQTRNINLNLQNGKVVMSGPKSQLISNQIKNNKYLKLALLSESLNYEKPIYSSTQNPLKNQQNINEIYKHRSTLRQKRTNNITKQEKQAIKIARKKDLQLVSDQDIYFDKEAYKIFETQQQRLLRLQIKYYDMLISEIQSDRKKRGEEGEEQLKTEEEIQNLQNNREQAIKDFRRVKYRLETRYQNISAEQLLFPEHEELGNAVEFEKQVEYEDIIGYLRKKSEERRLTSLEQSMDDKISVIARVIQVSEAAIPQGTVISTIE